MRQAPSKNFSEVIAPGEEEKFATYARKLRLIQKVQAKKYGKGRLLHRKGVLALRGQFIVESGLAPHAAQGIFATPGRYEAVIRLSNGSLDVKADKVPDIRGFAFKVMGVQGKSALGGQTTNEQDFLLINHTAFGAARAEEFLDLLLALSAGGSAVFRHFYNTYGLIGMFAAMGRLARTIGKKFTGFASETFNTVAPFSNGEYAVKLRLRPLSKPTAPFDKTDLTADLRAHLKSAPLEYAVELQFFTDAKATPIEDASVEWSEEASPFVSVGRLVIPAQELAGSTYDTFAAETELKKFDPWNALEEHRPLGNIMRARKHAYYASQKERGAQ